MDINVHSFDQVHLLGDSATRSPAPRLTRHAALLVLAGRQPAASSRLAWHANHGAGERVQLPFLG